MKKVNHLESSMVDLSIYGTLIEEIEMRLFGALQGLHPMDLSYGHTERWICFEENEPIGLLLISVIPDLRVGVIERLIVDPKQRQQGIATLLLQEALPTLKKLNIEVVSFYYPVNTKASPSLEKLIDRFDAKTPSKPFVKKYRFSVPDFQPYWLKNEFPLSTDFSLILWDELTEQERSNLQKEFDEGKIPSALTPFHHPELVCKECSVAVRSANDKIVAWMVCHFVKEREVEFSSLYVCPSTQKFALGVIVLSEAIRRLQQAKIPYATMTIRLHDKGKKTWSHFIQKRLEPYSLEATEIHESFMMLDTRN